MIFCVEDDNNIRDLLVYTLETTGFHARGLEDSQELWKALAEEEPELILLDIMLPGEDGYSILEKLKKSSGTRDIPMTEEAYNILKNQREQKNKVISLEFANLVFFNRKGNPTLFSAYNGKLSEIADKLSIQKFSIHSLRHTFATRCIEGGMRPKTLQKILGHSTLAITMDRYVHVVEDEQQKEMENIQSYLKVVG